MKILNLGIQKLCFCTLALFGLLLGSANAIPIIGSVDYGTTVTFKTSQYGSITTIDSANYLDFAPTASGLIVTDAFSGLTSITLNDFSIDPFSNPTWVWTGSPFTFTLTSLNIVTQNAVDLLVKGSGFFSATGFDDSDATWSLSATKATNSPGTTLFFSASTASVPEPNVILLMGMGLALVGVSFIRRKV